MPSPEKINTREYWEKRYLEEDSPWEIGAPNVNLLESFIRLVKKTDRILIPGAGEGHEAAWLYERGYKNVFVSEWSDSAREKMLALYPDFPENQILTADYFSLSGPYDAILEQTFFCALTPDKRDAYLTHTRDLLTPDGLLYGVLFNRTFPEPGPPFGGSIDAYRNQFQQYFEIREISPWSGSIPPRKGTECIIEMKPRRNPNR